MSRPKQTKKQKKAKELARRRSIESTQEYLDLMDKHYEFENSKRRLRSKVRNDFRRKNILDKRSSDDNRGN